MLTGDIMRSNELDRQKFMNEVREHMERILEKVSRQVLADELGVTKQAISSYVKGRTTPKPHILRRLLARWPHIFRYRGAEFGPGAFGVEPGRTTAIARQEYLFDLLSGVKKENMRVEVERRSGGVVAELRLIIKLHA